MGAGGLHNYMCKGDTAEWQWSVAPMGIGEGARVSVAMRLGGLGNSMAAMFKLELELQPGQKSNGYRMALQWVCCYGWGGHWQKTEETVTSGGVVTGRRQKRQ